MRLALVDGAAGLVVTARPAGVVLAFTVRDGKIAEIDVLADPERLARLDLTSSADDLFWRPVTSIGSAVSSQ